MTVRAPACASAWESSALMVRVAVVERAGEDLQRLTGRMPAALPQVWCYVTTVTWGRLFMHDLATGAAVELEGARSEPAVLAIHQDSKGFIWLGHKGGLVRVWSEAARRPVCPVKKCFHSEIRCGPRGGIWTPALMCLRQARCQRLRCSPGAVCLLRYASTVSTQVCMRVSPPARLPSMSGLCCRVIETDEDGTAWIGSEAGNVKRVELKTSKLEGGGARQWLEFSTTLKWRKGLMRTELSSVPQQGAAIASSSGGSTAMAASGELAAEAGDPGGPAGWATMCCRQTCGSVPFCCA